jgi:hypothetical protein
MEVACLLYRWTDPVVLKELTLQWDSLCLRGRTSHRKRLRLWEELTLKRDLRCVGEEMTL